MAAGSSLQLEKRPCLPQLEEARVQQEDPATKKSEIIKMSISQAYWNYEIKVEYLKSLLYYSSLCNYKIWVFQVWKFIESNFCNYLQISFSY